MGLIRKSLRIATLPLGPAGVSGSSKKQSVAAATLNEVRTQTRLLETGLTDAQRTTLALAEARVGLAEQRLKLAQQRRKKVAEREDQLLEKMIELEELRNKFGI